MKGYKATDKDMKCRDFQFELGKWYEHDGELITCSSGFHFCEQPSGPWAYYYEPTTRIFEIEANDVLEVPFEPGADFKRVAKRIKLVKEITPPKENGSNTGNRNTGNRNTGYGNTGNRNTGYGNTGNGNTGNGNTGDRNTGNGNTGYGNTGNGNTGDRNTGNGNTGYGNSTNYCSGFFCLKEPKVISFDKQTKLTNEQYLKKYPEYFDLCEALVKPEPIDIEKFKRLPGITKGKLAALHKKHLEGRKK